MKTIIKYDPLKDNIYQHMFPSGIAVALDMDKWYMEAKNKEPNFILSPHLKFAMHHFKVFDLLLDLPIDAYFPFEQYEETTLLPPGLPIAAKRLKAFAESISVGEEKQIKWDGNPSTECCITIDFDRFNKELLELVTFIDETTKYPKKSIEWWL